MSQQASHLGGGGAQLDRIGNILGALSLAVADRTSDAVTGAAGQSESAAVTLSALQHFLGSPSIDLLRQVLGLTSSGTVRLVDRLEAAGYITRGAGTDGRSTTVTLTPSGRRTAARVATARAGVLESALGGLSPSERATLAELMSRVLAGLVRGPGAVRWICRLCDTTACGRDAGQCPAANAALGRRPP